MLLIVAVLAFACSVVYVKNTNRSLFSELQSLQYKDERLKVEWGQLLLEQSTWATQVRVQRIAQQGLKMHLPQLENTVVVKL